MLTFWAYAQFRQNESPAEQLARLAHQERKATISLLPDPTAVRRIWAFEGFWRDSLNGRVLSTMVEGDAAELRVLNHIAPVYLINVDAKNLVKQCGNVPATAWHGGSKEVDGIPVEGTWSSTEHSFTGDSVPSVLSGPAAAAEAAGSKTISRDGEDDVVVSLSTSNVKLKFNPSGQANGPHRDWAQHNFARTTLGRCLIAIGVNHWLLFQSPTSGLWYALEMLPYHVMVMAFQAQGGLHACASLELKQSVLTPIDGSPANTLVCDVNVEGIDAIEIGELRRNPIFAEAVHELGHAFFSELGASTFDAAIAPRAGAPTPSRGAVEFSRELHWERLREVSNGEDLLHSWADVRSAGETAKLMRLQVAGKDEAREESEAATAALYATHSAKRNAALAARAAWIVAARVAKEADVAWLLAHVTDDMKAAAETASVNRELGYIRPYLGVSWFKRYQKWQATIQVAGVQQHLGYFDVKEDGALMRDAYVIAYKLRIRYPGRFAMNFG